MNRLAVLRQSLEEVSSLLIIHHQWCIIYSRCVNTFHADALQEENFYWNLNFAILLTGNSLNLNSAYYLLYFLGISQ